MKIVSSFFKSAVLLIFLFSLNVKAQWVDDNMPPEPPMYRSDGPGAPSDHPNAVIDMYAPYAIALALIIIIFYFLKSKKKSKI